MCLFCGCCYYGEIIVEGDLLAYQKSRISLLVLLIYIVYFIVHPTGNFKITLFDLYMKLRKLKH